MCRVPRDIHHSIDGQQLDTNTDRSQSYFEQNAAEIAKNLKEFSQSAETVSKNWSRLLQKYPSRWIAVFKGEVIADSGELNSLVGELNQRDIPVNKTIIRLMNDDKRTLVF